MTFPSHLAGLGGANFIQGLVHLGDDVEAVEDMQRLGTFLADHLQVGLPHIRADELDLRRQLLSDDSEETLEGFNGAFLPDPEQAGEPLVDLVNQGQVFVAFGVLDFIHTDGSDRLVLTIAPGNFLDDHATVSALDAPHAVQQEYQKAPQRNELEAPRGKMIVTRCRLVAPRTDRRRTRPRPDVDFDALLVGCEAGVLVDEPAMAMAVI